MKITQSNFIQSLEDPNQHQYNCANSSIKDQEEARKELVEIEPSFFFHIQMILKNIPIINSKNDVTTNVNFKICLRGLQYVYLRNS